MSLFKVLFVDDDKKFLEGLGPALKWDFEVSTTASPREAIELCRTQSLDAIVIDIVMPMMNGYELMTELKKIQPDAGYFFLTCFNDDRTYLESLNVAPDDFLSKPITTKRLSAAITHRLRRRQLPTVLKFGQLELNLENGLALIGSEPVELTQKEEHILRLLMKSAERKVPKVQILENLWGHVTVSQHTLDTHLSNLRRKIAPAGLNLTIDRDRNVCLLEN